MATTEAITGLSALKVSLIYSPAPRTVREWVLALAPGATVASALEAGRIFEEYPELHPDRLRVGIWGKKCSLGHVLEEGDRVEIYRPLLVDPKASRRERFNRQGAKSAGLFAKSRAGAKAGY